MSKIIVYANVHEQKVYATLSEKVYGKGPDMGRFSDAYNLCKVTSKKAYGEVIYLGDLILTVSVRQHCQQRHGEGSPLSDFSAAVNSPGFPGSEMVPRG